MTDSRLLRGAVLTFDDDPGESPVPRPDSLRYWEDGAVWLENGHIHAVDDYTTLAPHVPAGLEIVDYRGKLIMPGFIDSHVHYSQLDIIASFGRELLDWLNDYTFPAECRFAERAHAEEVAERFLDELLRGGTTTAQVFCTSHPGSVDSIFSAARARRLRLLAGKVLMDRHAPEALIDTAVGGIRDSERLIADWHGKDRLAYSLTPRFAPTSSREQLDAVGGVLRNDASLYLQSHLSENRGELAWVAELFPECRDYLAVYERHGLVGPRSTYAHGIHLSANERARLAEAGANIAFSPTSNLFLGSGLFDRLATREAGVATSLASDVGAGTGLCGLTTLQGAYQVGALLGQPLTAWQGFYRLTLGNARALHLADCIGRLKAGHEADLVVLDLTATPLMARRTQVAETLGERLFALMMLGDDRSVHATWASGRPVHQRDASGTHAAPSRHMAHSST
ncbi:guanine deaminase [Chromohalobacter marismortui]|uniref:Guanine deaminase n=1 Tax=Chromohalobacter marismortui TaxID=42055 RepID=A0A4R7NVL6_9GAMM|nr:MULTISPECIES: guanine deaminase [Chromohalobacter]MCI0511209.1 guanine deaminase [Chromohalobacter sp.]MCI0593935.1 guanine deaminase [Chromohalobacter sp.]TDU25234.1 guanine deaminase [Chromohalobacter marismortui]